MSSACKFLMLLLKDITDYDLAVARYNEELAYFKQISKARVPLVKAKGKAGLAFLVVYCLLLNEWVFLWKRWAKMTNHLESFNHQIKHKYFTPYYHSGRLPRIDAWVYTLVVKVLPAFFVQREERTTKVDYYLGMRRTIYHGNYSASDESDISIPVVDPPMAEVDKIDDVDCTLMISEMVNEATSEALELLEDCNDDVEVMPLILSSDSNSCSLIINAENLGADRMEIDDPELCFNGWDELVLDTDDILCNINDLDLPQTLLSCSDHPCLLPPSPERSHKINTGPITPITPIHILDTTHSIPHINPQMDDDDGLYDSKSFDDLHTEAEAIYMQKMLTAEDTLVQSLQKLMPMTHTSVNTYENGFQGTTIPLP
ncbi:hypothetical protein P692DRAFT_20819335 [Suillus brevipes Sb2]|nr:hypothetical protein P692DRAFT_20819335 [Suillus brevipes Sb2]